MKYAKTLSAIIAGAIFVSGLAIVGMGGDQGEVITPDSQPLPETKAYSKVPRVVFWEDFTGWNCGPCAAYNPYLEGATNAFTGGWLKNVAPSFNHVWWPGADDDPMHNSGNNTHHWAMHFRTERLYGVTFAPDTYIDGIDYPQTSNQATITGYFNARRTAMANMTLDMKAYINTATNTGTVKIRAECTYPTTATDLRLVINLWENNITRTLNGDAPPYPNGETHMAWAVWRVFPDANGTKVTLKYPGDVFEGTYSFGYDSTFVEANLGLSAFIQDFGGTKLIEQAATVANFKQPLVALISPGPSGLNQLYSGTVPISWTTQDSFTATNGITIDYSTNNGTSWTNIVTNTANTPPYNWNTGTLNSATIKLRVTARNTGGYTGNDTSIQFISVANQPNVRWYLQAQSNFITGMKDLDMKPIDRYMYNYWDGYMYGGVSTAPLSTASDVVVQSYASGFQAAQTYDVVGQWNFSVVGRANISTPMPAGNYFARVYANNGVTARLLFTTAYDDENVGTFTAPHTFAWVYTAPSALINSGERIQVDVVMHATSASAAAKYNWELRGEYTQPDDYVSRLYKGTKTGDYTRLAVQDATAETLTEVVYNPSATAIWQENFTACAPPAMPTGWGKSGSPYTWSKWNTSLKNDAGGKQAYELLWSYYSGSATNVNLRCYYGPINTVGMTALDLYWMEKIGELTTTGYTLRIETATSTAGPWTATSWSYTGVGGNVVLGPRAANTTIRTANVGSANLYISFTHAGPLNAGYYWRIDDLVLKQYSRTSLVDQRYLIGAPQGETSYTFSAYANRPASADADNFAVDYSTDGTTFTQMVTINTPTYAWYNYTFPAAPAASRLYLRVRDTVRTEGAITLSSVNIDRMYIYTNAPTKVSVISDSWVSQSYVEPRLTIAAAAAPPWQNITVIAGWNLVSVNLTGPTTMPAALTDKTGGVVWTRAMWYNPQTPTDPWKQYNTGWNAALNSLTTVDATMGVWLYVTVVGDGQICVGGTGYSKPVTTAVQLRAGWNLVGFPSDDTTYTMAMLKAACPTVTIVEQFNGAQTYLTLAMADADVFAPDKAYWVYTSADVVWNKAY